VWVLVPFKWPLPAGGWITDKFNGKARQLSRTPAAIARFSWQAENEGDENEGRVAARVIIDRMIEPKKH
jgi:hypothetical protein